MTEKSYQQIERDRCIAVCLAEYAYWRDVTDERIVDFAMGAMGAAANMLCRIIDPSRTAHGRGDETQDTKS